MRTLIENYIFQYWHISSRFEWCFRPVAFCIDKPRSGAQSSGVCMFLPLIWQPVVLRLPYVDYSSK